MTPTRRALLVGTPAAALLAGRAAAQPDFPSRPIRIVVPYAPGGLTDLAARLVGEGLSRQFGQPVVVENRAGANGIVGVGAVAASPPDGHALAMVVGAHAINATLYAGRLPYDPIAGFAPVSHVVSSPILYVAGPQPRVSDLAGLTALVRDRPETLAFGSSGIGSLSHLSIEDLLQRTGGRMIHSSYRGTQPALQDLAGGRVALMADVPSTVGPLIQAGSIRGLAVAQAARLAAFPDIPTTTEAGVPGLNVTAWCMLLAPAGTPPSIVKRLSEATASLLRAPETRPRLDALGFEAVGTTPEDALAFLRAEIERWSGVIRRADVRVD